MARYFVCLYTVTAGLQEESLGSDEQEIVLFSWVVVDLTNTKVRIRIYFNRSLPSIDIIPNFIT